MSGGSHPYETVTRARQVREMRRGVRGGGVRSGRPTQPAAAV